jgi:hypothetical protein
MAGGMTDHARAGRGMRLQGGATDPGMVDAGYVQRRLEAACRAMQAMPGSVGPARLSAQSYGYVPELTECSRSGGKVRYRPDAQEIAEMDEALGWLTLIENDVLRRIVSARSIIDPSSYQHKHSWRSLGLSLGADHRAVKVWHGQGIKLIVKALKGRRK